MPLHSLFPSGLAPALRGGLLGGLLGATVLSAPARAETWTMATPYPAETFHGRNIASFAEEVARLTEGALTIEVHPANSLYPHAEIAGAVQAGEIQLGEVFQSTLTARDSAFGADSLPFLATSYGEARALYAVEKVRLAEALARDGMVPLFAVPWPPQGLYTKVEITDPEALRGLAFRTYNGLTQGFAEGLGAAPTQIEAVDIPAAFAEGRIDVMITSPSTGVSTQAWDFLDYFYDIQAWLPKNIIFVNAAALEALPPAQRDAVLTAAAFAEENGWLLSQIDAIEAVKALFDNGMTILTPGEAMASDTSGGGAMRSVSPALLDALARSGAAVRDGWTRDASPDALVIINEYLEQTND